MIKIRYNITSGMLAPVSELCDTDDIGLSMAPLHLLGQDDQNDF